MEPSLDNLFGRPHLPEVEGEAFDSDGPSKKPELLHDPDQILAETPEAIIESRQAARARDLFER